MALKSIWGTVCIILTVTSFNLNAALIDNGTYVSDTESGLDWLDWEMTANMTFDFVQSELGTGGLFDGWQVASSDDINSVNPDRIINDPDANEFYFTVVNPHAPEDRFWETFEYRPIAAFSSSSLLDIEYDSEGNYLRSMHEPLMPNVYCTDPPNPTNGKTGECYVLDLSGPSSVFAYSDTSDPNLSTALVRSSTSVVPVPAAVWLFGSGLIGLLGFARRKKS